MSVSVCVCVCIQIFRDLHQLYADALCNPFVALDARIASPRFDRAVGSLMERASVLLCVESFGRGPTS